MTQVIVYIYNVFTLLIYLCGTIFVFVFLVNVFNKEFNYMNNNCYNKLHSSKNRGAAPLNKKMYHNHNLGNYKVSQTKHGSQWDYTGIGLTFTKNGVGVRISMVF
jgi:hypothetical protein